MKHLLSFLTLLLAALLPFDLSAAPVSAEKAQAKAIAFFVQSTPTRSAPSLRLVWDGESAATRANAEPALYVFNRTDAPGFVIMAGDDAVTPILGYSFENPFGDVGRMPANLRWWLDGLRSMILDARASGAAPDAAWSSVSRADEEGSKVLETALWDQEDPYNGECPEYNGKRLYTGCTQTAEAIVMKYNRWPETVGKSVPGYRSESTDKDDKPLAINVKGRTLGTYDWDLMPDKYDKSATPEQRAEVARLMADLGVLNQAMYGEEGTGAYSNDQHKGLVSVLKYSKQARLVNRDGYTDEEWLALMRAEIDANRPVLYSGVSEKEGGHAFVLAGYKPTSPECYFNWGWSGDGNGWFTVAKFGTPPANPFLLMQDAIVGLVKDPDESSQYSDNLMLGAQQANDGTYYVGLKSAAAQYRKGERFTMEQFGFIWNMGATAYNGKVALALYAADGTQKAFLTIYSGKETTTELPFDGMPVMRGSAYQNISCSILCDIRPGDYIAGAFYNNGTQQWEQMRAYDENTVAKIVVMAEPDSPDAIAAATSLAYDRTKRQLTLQTIAGLKCTVKAPDGSLKHNAEIGDAALVLDASKWAAGAYTLTLTPDGGDPYELKIVL